MYNLIIVEDNNDVKEGLSNFFPWEDVGMTLKACFPNGEEAYRYIENNPVDAVLSDVVMPVMDGLALAEKIRENHPRIKVVLLSAHSNFSYAQKAIDFSVYSYMVKPSKYSRLREVFGAIREELDHSRGEGEPENVPGRGGKIERVKHYVNNNLRQASLKGAADVIGMNPFYLSEYFKKKTGRNFSDYLNEVKMARAKELINSGEYLLYEISDMLGFSNPSNFSRSFREHYGVSPKDYC